MSIGLRCQACAREYHVNAALAGKRVKCKACGAAIRVPAAAIDPQIPSINATAVHEPSATLAVLSTAEPERRSNSAEPIPSPKPTPPGGPLRRVYQVIAAIVILGFLSLVYLLGREAGIWGESQPRRSQVARVLTSDEKLARDRYISQANLIRLGLALELWAKGHRGMYPAKLDEVNEVAELTPDVFLSPFLTDQTPSPLREHSYHYLYVRSMGVAIHNATVLAYDAVELAAGQGTNVLYGSGEVKWIPAEELTTQIARSEAHRLGIASADAPDSETEKLAARRADHHKFPKLRRD